MKGTYRKPAAEPRGDIVSATLNGIGGTENGDFQQPVGGARLSFGL